MRSSIGDGGTWWRRGLMLALGASCSAACSSFDPGGPEGSGSLAFTTWGEDFIEQQIPAAPSGEDGFIDGWTVRYEKFLVNFQNITVADGVGKRAAVMAGSKLFDNHQPGVKPIIDFPEVSARAWDRVSYEIAPASASTVLDSSASEADAAEMREHGFSLLVAGTASKDQRTMHFSWGFPSHTLYLDCHSSQGGREQNGVLVRSHSSVEVQLTTHGDHLFYDRLQASPDPAIATSLRFEALASSDANRDGELTLAELDAQIIDVRLYDPSGLGAATYGAFMRTLVRTVGHFRGEGECTVNEPAAD